MAGIPRFEAGDIIRFTYDTHTADQAEREPHKEVFVLNPLWNNKVHGLDLKRLDQQDREIIDALFNPDRKNEVHPINLVNQVKKSDPVKMAKTSPQVFYMRFVKPLLKRKNTDAYRQYWPNTRYMTNVTVVRNADVKTGRSKNIKPLFGPKPQPVGEPKALTPIDIMAQNAKKDQK